MKKRLVITLAINNNNYQAQLKVPLYIFYLLKALNYIRFLSKIEK